MCAVKHQHCQTSLKYDTALQMRQLYKYSLWCILIFEVVYVSACCWPLKCHGWSKRSLREPLSFYSRQKLIGWDILCQLQSMLNPCRWAVQKGAIKVLLNFLWMGFHPSGSDDIRLVESLYGRLCHKWHSYYGDLRCDSAWWVFVINCESSYNTSMISVLI